MMDGGDAPSAKFTLKESISRTFGTGFLDGSITAVSAEKATMAPPGAPRHATSSSGGGAFTASWRREVSRKRSRKLCRLKRR